MSQYEPIEAPRAIETPVRRLNVAFAEECRLAAMPDRTPAEESRLRQLQTENALAQAGQDELPPKKHYRNNPHAD